MVLCLFGVGMAGWLAPSLPEGFLGGISGGARFVVRVYSQSSPPLTKR